jgi:hypothetical protein
MRHETAMPIMRSGSILLLAVAVVAILLALAYGFLVSTRIALDAGKGSNLHLYAQSAAQSGLAHAYAVLERDFLANPGEPTHFRQHYRADFWPIDSYMNAPVGQDAGTLGPEEENQNDSSTENLLTELYAVYGTGPNAQVGAYWGRNNKFMAGTFMHPGCGRWIEPGYHFLDGASKPFSFHLPYPYTTAVADWDPARTTVRDYGSDPDVDVPLYLSAQLQRVATRDLARYRLRYAVAIEDISNRLLGCPQGAYVPAPSAKTGATVSDSVANGVREVDAAAARKYVSPFVNVGNYTASSDGGWHAHWAWDSFLGHGSPPLYKNWASLASWPLPVRFDASSNAYRVDEVLPAAPTIDDHNRIFSGEAVTTIDLYVANQGPWYSWDSFAWSITSNDSGRQSVHTYSPFGSRGQLTASPGRWDSAYVDTPWRINLITAPPRIIGRMVDAYLPREVWTSDGICQMRWKKQVKVGALWVDTAAVIAPAPGYTRTTWTEFRPDNLRMTNLFTDIPDDGNPNGFHAIFRRMQNGAFASESYPGSHRYSDPGLWHRDLGSHVDLNVFAGTHNDVQRCRPPMWGQYMGLSGDDQPSYQIARDHGPSDSGDWQLTTPPPALISPETTADTRWVTEQDVATSVGSWDQLVASRGFLNDSYFLDVGTACFHAIAVTQLAWMGNADPASGAGQVIRYPAGAPGPFAAVAGQPVLDLDLTLPVDGVPDAPALLDTIAEVDALFVRNLGESPEDHATGGRPATPGAGLYVQKASGLNAKASIITFTTNANIKSLRLAGTITPEQANLMELAVNDFRLSFFGSSAQYPDFKAIDFSDDGNVFCSAFANAHNAAGGDGKAAVPVADRFSLTGYFVMQKSRYFRIFCRGEVFDELLQRPVANCDTESVYCLDPDGAIYGLNDQAVYGGARPALQTRVLFQRMMENRYVGTMSRADTQ